MNFDEDTDELSSYTEDQATLANMLSNGDLYIEHDGYPAFIESVSFYEDGKTYISVRLTPNTPE